MSYRPRTARSVHYHDGILAALRDGATLTTVELCRRLGDITLPEMGRPSWCAGCPTCMDRGGRHAGTVRRPVTSSDVQSVMLGMTRSGELVKLDAGDRGALRWRLGPGAPAATDVAELEELLELEGGDR
jgi:hypothetical protein